MLVFVRKPEMNWVEFFIFFEDFKSLIPSIKSNTTIIAHIFTLNVPNLSIFFNNKKKVLSNILHWLQLKMKLRL